MGSKTIDFIILDESSFLLNSLYKILRHEDGIAKLGFRASYLPGVLAGRRYHWAVFISKAKSPS